MHACAAEVLSKVRKHCAAYEVSVKSLVALLETEQCKRWPPYLRVAVIQAAYDGISLGDLPNIHNLLGTLSSFEHCLLSHRLGWRMVLDPYRCVRIRWLSKVNSDVTWHQLLGLEG
jgi:hypothetical protein